MWHSAFYNLFYRHLFTVPWNWSLMFIFTKGITQQSYFYKSSRDLPDSGKILVKIFYFVINNIFNSDNRLEEMRMRFYIFFYNKALLYEVKQSEMKFPQNYQFPEKYQRKTLINTITEELYRYR